jgi:pimeloyl-ACP methyl ester carboxylesterase
MKRFVSFVVGGVLATCFASAGASADVVCLVPPEHKASDHTVISTDGTPIAITVFQPKITQCSEEHAPVILTLHGWSGSRWKTVDQAKGFLDAGYGVIGIDARGHGDSGGQALAHHPSREINDFRAVMDWVYDHVEWIQRQGFPFQKDFVVGASGGSYGGGFQLMTAAFDRRLDAIVPEITWNNLAQSLAPNGVVKSTWIALLYAAGKLSVDMDRRIDEWFAETMATNRPAPDNVHSFEESSPSYWMQNINVPTLLVQGMPDTVFPLNQAVNNYIGIRNNGSPVWIVGHNSGHILPALQPAGVGAPARSGSPCGSIAELRLRFFDAYLKYDEAALESFAKRPHVTIPTEQGDCLTASDWPINASSTDVTFPIVVVPQMAGSQLLPLFIADKETVVAGIPQLRSQAPIELDDIFILSLVLKDANGLHVVDDQMMGARTQIASVEGTYNVDLGAVATKMAPGDELFLRIDGTNEQYVINGGRKPGAAVLLNATLSVPVVS